MKSEPLTNKIKEWWNQARVMLDPKNEEAFRDEVNNLILIIKRWEKQKVEELLKEIEKEKKKIENLKPIYNDYGNYEDWTCPICKIHFKEETKAYEHVEWEKRELRKTKGKMLNWFEDLIKKAFSGVIPKEGEVGSRKTQCPSDCREMAGHPHPREKGVQRGG